MGVSVTVQWQPETVLRELGAGKERDPSAAYESLLSQCPVGRYDSDEGYSLWGIFSHSEVAKAALDTETFSSVTVPEGFPRILPLMADPPEQTAYRRLINPFFSSGPVTAVEREMRPVAAELINAMVERGESDLAADFAYPFSTQVLCRFLSVTDDWHIYNDWSAEMERLTKAGMAKPGTPLPMDHFNKVIPYLQQLITDRRAHPGDDVVSGIILGDVDGRKLDDAAVVGLIIALILAGRSTTASGIGNLVLRLAQDPSLQEFLRDRPERIGDAVEESLRIEAPQQEQPRKCTRDVEIGDHMFRAGDPVFLNFGSANVDPAAWESPETFDLDRSKKRHLAFGRAIVSAMGLHSPAWRCG